MNGQQVVSGSMAITRARMDNLAQYSVDSDYQKYSAQILAAIAHAHNCYCRLRFLGEEFDEASRIAAGEMPDGAEVTFNANIQMAVAEAGAMWAAVYDLIQMCNDTGRDIYDTPQHIAPRIAHHATPDPFTPEPPANQMTDEGPTRLFAGVPIHRPRNAPW